MLSPQQFEESCDMFLSKSLKINDGWSKVISSGSNDECNSYLSKKSVKYDKKKNLCEKNMNLISSLEEDLMDDLNDLSTLECEAPEEITSEYHIMYSLSHSVPVLYFNVWNSSGKLLKLEEIWNRVDYSCKAEVLHRRWESLTQVEHPFLCRPYFQLHPCRTADVMKQILDPEKKHSNNYLAVWLSLFGPSIGIEVSPGYFTDCVENT